MPRSSTEQRGATASTFKPQPPALERWASLAAKRSAALFFHLLRTFPSSLEFLVSYSENAVSSSFSLSLSFPSLSISLYEYSYLPLEEFLPSSHGYCFPAPRCTRDSTAFFFFLRLMILSTIGVSFSIVLFFVSLRDTLVSLSVLFASCLLGALHSQDVHSRETLHLM